MNHYVQLADVISEIGNGMNAEQFDIPDDGMLPITRIETISQGTIDLKRVKYAHASDSERLKYLLRPGDVLFSHINSPDHIGKTALVASDTPLLHGINLLLLRPDQSRCDPQYLSYFLKSADVRAYFKAHCKPSVNQSSLNQEDIVSIFIPLLPLPEQRRIAAILRAADDERRRRRYTQSLSDGLLGDIFVRMFGDPATNPMGWEVRDVGALLSTPPRIGTTQPAIGSGSHLCVRVGEIGNGHNVDLESCKYVSLDNEEFARYSVATDDILLARAIGSEEHLGKFSIMQRTSRPVVFDSHVMRLRLNQNLLHLAYFAALMQTDGGRSLFMEQARQTAVQFNVNAEQIQAMRIPVPPIELQRDFAPVAAEHEQTRRQQQESARQSDHLFDTLLHRAFAGEL